MYSRSTNSRTTDSIYVANPQITVEVPSYSFHGCASKALRPTPPPAASAPVVASSELVEAVWPDPVFSLSHGFHVTVAVDLPSRKERESGNSESNNRD